MTNGPPDDRLDRAKAVFRDYWGRKFLMSRDGVDSEYDSYGSTGEQEAQWRRELIGELVNRLSPNEVEPLFHLRLMDATEVIPRLLELAPLGDSYAQLEYADALWEIARRCPWRLSPELVERSKNAAIELWQSIAASPPSLSDGRILPEWLSADAIGAAARERLKNISEGRDALNPGFKLPEMGLIIRSLVAVYLWIDRAWQRLWRRS